jgi:hypothetical protein
MDALMELLETTRTKQLARGRFRGFLHILIGRRIVGPGGEIVSAGMTFRDVATLLKKVRWDPDDVKELGIDPETLPPRDRQRYWFIAICQARVDGPSALAEADDVRPLLEAEGYKIGPSPGQDRSAPADGIHLRT